MVNSRILDIIINEGRCENIFSKKTTKGLNLSVEKYLQSYTTGWIKSVGADIGDQEMQDIILYRQIQG